MWQAFGLLARLRFLRGTALDVFGRTEERRLERQLIADYEATIAALLPRLRADNLVRAAELANLPDQIRGFGHVKLESIGKVRARWKALEDELQGRAPAPAVVEPPARPLHAA
jgi:indolepyruvate ferredoxin oxidoreductase